MKRIFGTSLVVLMIGMRAYAEYGIPTEKIYNFDRANVASVLEEFIEDEKKAQAAADKYNELSNNGENTISAVDFVDVCVVGGFKINASDGSGYTKCLEMFMRLIEMQNMDVGDFNMYCPATGNTLKSITDKTQIGDSCGGTPDTYIEYGHVTVKAVDSNSNRTVSLWKVKNNKVGEHKYVCTCTPQSCKDGYYWNKEKYQCSVKDKEGYCVRRILGSFEYKNGKLPTDSGVGLNDWNKKNNAYYNDKYAQINASADAFNRCVEYGAKQGCRIRGALATADVGSGFTSAKKYQVICNPANYEIAADKKVQEEKDKKYQEAKKKHEEDVEKKKRANVVYHEVCGDAKGKTGGTERCIEVFDDIEVQAAQAKNLAQEYAKIKYNDDIECNLKVREGPMDDYMKCTSINSNTFYEFVFDDAKESNANAGEYVTREFGRGLCLIYGGAPESVRSKVTAGVVGLGGTDFECSVSSCSSLMFSLEKWGYTSYISSRTRKCIVDYVGVTSKSIKNSNSNYYAKFDGYNLTIYNRDSVEKSWPAVSGRGKTPTDSKRTVCQTPKYQACEDIGPTPSGVYYISQNDIQYFDNITMGNYNSNSPLADREGRAWGEARVKLKPDSSTELYNRKADMYIHGGWYAGSSGCIDLTKNILDFVDWFAKQPNLPILKVVVDYGSVPEMCGEKCVGSKCSMCECKKVINKDTNETNCDYI